jgi:hypothetical protein
LQTADALQYLERQEPGPLGREAGYLRQEINGYANAIETDPSDALQRIGDWQDRIRPWAESDRGRGF